VDIQPVCIVDFLGKSDGYNTEANKDHQNGCLHGILGELKRVDTKVSQHLWKLNNSFSNVGVTVKGGELLV
jgi:hypothetical protein